MLLALLPAALANGQTSHQWITLAAIDAVPPGELADFLARADVRDALLNGTMFPDGGYAVGDDYGEMAHWEPTQDLYLAWIVANHPPPWDDEAARHVAFFLGMRSHGMADQFYDGTFMERSKAWDPPESWACCSMDEATDVAFAAETGPGTAPPTWWPVELLGFFAEKGHTVDEATVDQGQALLGIAIGYVGAAAAYPETVARYTDQFPWACTHQTDPSVVGNPPHEAAIVAAYWQVAWDQLHGGDGWTAPVIATVPAAGGRQPVLDHTHLDARLAVVFAKGLDPGTVEAEGAITVATADGASVPVRAHVFYGTASHVVNLTPDADWSPDTDYVLTVHAGVRTYDGLETRAPIAVPFTTRTPAEDTGATDAAPGPAACGCASAADPGALALVGALAALARRGRQRELDGH